MNRSSNGIVVLFSLAFFVAAGVAHADTNLVPDPSFEDGSGTTATDWISVPWASRVEEFAHSGDYSMHVTEGGNVGYPHIDSDPITVTPGTEYLFSVWVMQDAAEPLASGDSVLFKASWGNAFSGVYDQTTVITSSTPMDQYVQGSFYATAPAGVTSVVLQLMIDAPTYSITSGAYFDDVSMTEVPAVTTVPLPSEIEMGGGLLGLLGLFAINKRKRLVQSI